MSERIQVGEAVFSVVADISKIGSNLAKGQAQVNGMVANAVKSVGQFKLAWGGAALAVGAFVVKSVVDYSKLDKAISNVVASATRYGIATDGLRGKVEKYLDVMENTTRFQDDELADSLNEILGKTKDLGQAMFLNSLAADLSVRRNIPLAASAEMLSNLYAGNTRGLMMVAKELGVTGAKAEDAVFLFDKLQKEMAGAAAEEDNQANSIKLMNTAFSNLGETIATNLSPTVRELARQFTVLFKAINKAIGGEEAQTDTQKFTERMKELGAEMQSIYAKGQDLSEQDRQRIQYLRGEIDLSQAMLQATLKGADAEKKAASAKIRAKLDGDQKLKRAQADAAEMDKFFAELAEEDAEKAEAKIKKQEEAYKHMGGVIAGQVSSSFESFFDTVLKGNASIADSFLELGKSIARGILNGIAVAVEGYSGEAFAKAIILAVNYDFAGAAKAAAGGAALAAAAGGIRALGANLAEGGFSVGGSTQEDSLPVNIRKNEAVVPLDDPRAVQNMREALSASGLGGGGSDGGRHVNIRQVVVPDASKAHGKTAAYRIGEEINKRELRGGIRGRRSGRG